MHRVCSDGVMPLAQPVPKTHALPLGRRPQQSRDCPIKKARKVDGRSGGVIAVALLGAKALSSPRSYRQLRAMLVC
jgi:hypothetical protein